MNGLAIKWLTHPITRDGSGYTLRSPAGASVEISVEDRTRINLGLRLLNEVRRLANKPCDGFDPEVRIANQLIERSLHAMSFTGD